MPVIGARAELGAAGPYLMNSCHSGHSCHARAQSADTVLSAEAAAVKGIVRSLAELSCHALRLRCKGISKILQDTCGVCGVCGVSR